MIHDAQFKSDSATIFASPSVALNMLIYAHAREIRGDNDNWYKFLRQVKKTTWLKFRMAFKGVEGSRYIRHVETQECLLRYVVASSCKIGTRRSTRRKEPRRRSETSRYLRLVSHTPFFQSIPSALVVDPSRQTTTESKQKPFTNCSFAREPWDDDDDPWFWLILDSQCKYRIWASDASWFRPDSGYYDASPAAGCRVLNPSPFIAQCNICMYSLFVKITVWVGLWKLMEALVAAKEKDVNAKRISGNPDSVYLKDQ